jgi:hypothetical protein
VLGECPPGKDCRDYNQKPCDSNLKSGSDVGRWDGKAFYFSVDDSPGYNQIGRVVVKLPYVNGYPFTFEELTPKGLDARAPSPAPLDTSSFVFVATEYKGKDQQGNNICVSPGAQWIDDGPVQIFRSDPSDRQKPKRLTHIPKGWTPTDPHWREITNVSVNSKDIPTAGIGAGTFHPTIWNYGRIR